MYLKKILFYSYLVAIGIIAYGCSKQNNSKSNDAESSNSLNEQQKTTNDYQKACKELDFETARECLNKIHQAYINHDIRSEIYYVAFDYVYTAEIQYILSEFDDKACVDKITFLLVGIPIEGQKPRAGLCKRSDVDRDGWSSESISLDAYIIWTEHYNRLCNTILTLSINRNYPKLAKAVLMQFADNVELTEGGEHWRTWPNGNSGYEDDYKKVDGVTIDRNHGYIKFTRTDRDAAKKKYNEAVKMGYLK